MNDMDDERGPERRREHLSTGDADDGEQLGPGQHVNLLC